jgi:hypothetical protein
MNFHKLLFKTEEILTTTLDTLALFTADNDNNNNSDNNKLPEK